MPCHSAVVPSLVTVQSDQTVGDAIRLMKKHDFDTIPVVDNQKKLLGLFSTRVLMRNLLPVSVAMQDDLQLGVKVSAAPGVARRLKKVGPLPVGQLMERKVNVIYPETPLWEGIRQLINSHEALFVVEKETGKLVGMVTGLSALAELERMQKKEGG